jgi:hypothetical protein
VDLEHAVLGEVGKALTRAADGPADLEIDATGVFPQTDVLLER